MLGDVIQNRSKVLRLQSAMEYLMTYGWAILIIAVVLGALFELGVFGGSAGSGTCTGEYGFLCSSEAVNTLGQITFTFGQSGGQTIYNVELSCAATVNSLGLPLVGNELAPVDPWWAIGGSGEAYYEPGNAPGIFTNNQLLSNNRMTVTGLQCYDASGNPLTGIIGTTFSGSIFIQYSNAGPNNQPPIWGSPSVPVITEKIISVNAQVK